MAEGAGFENRCSLYVCRGFKSHTLRKDFYKEIRMSVGEDYFEEYPEETEECSRCGATHVIYALDPDGVCIDCLRDPKSGRREKLEDRR